MQMNKVIVTDDIATTLITLLVKEKLVDRPEYIKSLRVSKSDAQNVLALLVMFDHVLLPDFSSKMKDVDLDDKTTVQIIPQIPTPISIQKVELTAGTDVISQAFSEALDMALKFRPIAVNRVVVDLEDNNFWSLLAKFLKVSRYELCTDALDYISVVYYGKNISLETNLIMKRVSSDIRALIDKDLSGGNNPMVGPSQMLFLSLIMAAHQISSFQQIMKEHAAGVASLKYTGLNTSFEPIMKGLNSPSKASESFHILRHAIHQEVSHFPRIDDVKHALRLRKDGNIRSYREQVEIFYDVLSKGEEDALVKAQKEVRRANKALQKAETWGQRLNWITYISLPASIVELLVGGIPIFTMPTSLFSIAKTIKNEHIKHENRWVMFGR